MKVARIRKALLKKRQLLVIQVIDVAAQEYLAASILYLNALSSSKPITIFIDSAGGKLDSELLSMDVIGNSRAPVHGIVTGVAYSAAFGVFQSCHVRKAYPHAQLRFHAPVLNGVNSGDKPVLDREIKQLQRIHTEQIKMFSMRSGQSQQQWRAWADAEHTFSAPEALRFRLLDSIIHPPKRRADSA